MKKKIGNILIILGIIFVIISLFIYVDLYLKDKKYDKENKKVLDTINEVIEKEEIVDKVTVDNKNYVGIISIPSLDLTLPIQDEWTKEKAVSSPAIYVGGINHYPLIIGGHNSNSQFNKLNKISVGTEVILITLQGEKYTFKVKDIETINGKDNKKMVETDYPLTLFTCTFDNQSRLTIRCI